MSREMTSPFTPGIPAPLELFVGREEQIRRLRRIVATSVEGRIKVAFLYGERGIGKSSLASFVRSLCEREERVLGLHTFLGQVTTLEEMVRRVFDQLIKRTIDTTTFEKIKALFGKRIQQIGLFGITASFEAPQEDLRRLVNDFAPAMRNLLEKLGDERRGILLILDDINGLASSSDFANWLKSLVDEISTSGSPLPLTLLLVGLEDRRHKMIELQPSLARVFDLIEICAWSDEECREFYSSRFSDVGIDIDDDALKMLAHYAGGLPVLAHEIGDAAFSLHENDRIDGGNAIQAVLDAADIVGRKHLAPTVFKTITSKKYRNILNALAADLSHEEFTRAEFIGRLGAGEQRVLDNFLRKMKDIGVISTVLEAGQGAYRFTSRLHYLYFHLAAIQSRESSR